MHTRIQKNRHNLELGAREYKNKILEVVAHYLHGKNPEENIHEGKNLWEKPKLKTSSY